MNINRRRFIIGASCSAVGGFVLLRFSSNGRSLLELPGQNMKASLAVDPATAIMVAKTGLDVYRMVKGGGGGVEDLLIAQTEMLRSISAQIVIVNEGIQMILAGVDGLRAMVRELPSQTVRELARSDLQAAFVNTSEKLDRFATLRERFGHTYARAQVEPDATLNLGRLEHSRAVLMGDSSPVVIPLVCAAWYVEFQALSSLVPFERERILSVARSYERWAARTGPLVNSLLTESAREAGELLVSAQRFRDSRDGPVCYSAIDFRMLGGDPYHPSYTYRLSASKHLVRYGAEEAESPIYATHFDELQQAQIPVAQDLRAYRRATVEFESTVKTTTRAGQYRAMRRERDELLRHECADPRPLGQPHADKFNGRADDVRGKALMHYHFFLAHREAHKSIRRTIARLTV